MIVPIRIKTLKRILKGRCEDKKKIDNIRTGKYIQNLVLNERIKELKELKERYTELMDKYIKLSEHVREEE